MLCYDKMNCMRYWLTKQVWQRVDKWFIIRSRELFSCGTELGNPGLMGYSQSEQRIHFILPTQGHFNLMSPLSFGFFQELLMKNDFLRACYVGFDWSGWIALIKNRILITKEMSWPVSSDKWKAPLVLTGESGNRHSKKKTRWNIQMYPQLSRKAKMAELGLVKAPTAA